MSKKPNLNAAALAEEVKAILRRGPGSAREICEALGISQAVFSRMSSGLKEELLTIGVGRSTRYALRRMIEGVGAEIPLYKIDAGGKSRRAGVLCSIFPRGFYWAEREIFSDLPYFFEDLRPAGFLGRLVPNQHPELDLPADINLWNADQTLRYLARFGWNLIGNWIVGEEAFRLYLNRQQAPLESVPLTSRPKVYAKMATDVLQLGEAGSSAGGEQPKFLSAKGPKGIPVIVKFSPNDNNAVSRRRADLLVSESLALQVLAKHGRKVAKAEILEGGQRTFLEMVRFDREGRLGRRGMISLKALNLEFSAKARGWGGVARELLKEKRISGEICREIEWLELFGKLIANSDMHLGNLSLYEEDLKVTGLCPVYDMLPMLYAPQNEQIVERNFRPELPAPREAALWREVLPAATEFWEVVAGNAKISPGFRKTAKENEKKLRALRDIVDLLPV